MTGDRLFWETTGYPRECPECGTATAARDPGLSAPQFAGWILFVTVVWQGFVYIRWFGALRALAPALVAVLALVVLLRQFFRAEGRRFLKHGFVACPGCGWTRCGEEEGPAIERARERGRLCLRTSLWALGPPSTFLLGTYALSLIDGAALYFLSALVPLATAVSLFSTFRPSRRPGCGRARP